MSFDFKNKKVLVMGLGFLGGGISAVRWFVRHGARVTVTDLKTAEALRDSLSRLESVRGKVRFVLGKHRLLDFRSNHFVVVNPSVPRDSSYLAAARRAGAHLINDALVFIESVSSSILAVTGTRGKTTTANWLAHFLSCRYPHIRVIGNSSSYSFFRALDSAVEHPQVPVVAELSSWQIEFLHNASRAPHIAVITNLYPDHQNRYSSLRSYATAKARLFRSQTPNDFLVLNLDNEWTPFFLEQNPRSRVYFFSSRPLPSKMSGIYGTPRTGIVFQKDGRTSTVLPPSSLSRFLLLWGDHNGYNLLAALLAAYLHGIPFTLLRRRLASLPAIPFREETVLRRRNLTIINDTTATTPEATLAAIRRFSKRTGRLVLVSGGTDKRLSYRLWARTVKNAVLPSDLFLLQGSATRKMLRELRRSGFAYSFNVYDSLSHLIQAVRDRTKEGPCFVLFSPSAASFEHFANEFQRGEEFNRLVKKYFK